MNVLKSVNFSLNDSLFLTGLCALVQELCIALQGSPIDEDTTIHILCSRAEVDLALVKSEFKSESNRALEDVLTSSTDTLPALLRHFFLTIITSSKETPGFTPRTSDGSGKSYYMSPRSTASHQISNGSQNDSYHSGSIGSSGSSSFQELWCSRTVIACKPCIWTNFYPISYSLHFQIERSNSRYGRSS